MVSAETLLSYPVWKLTFTVHTNASDEKLVAVISQSNKILPSSKKIEQANSITTLQLRRNFSQ